MKILFSLILLLVLAVLPACTTTNTTTGEKVFDPVKTERVKAAVSSSIVIAGRRLLDETYQENPNVLTYLESSAGLLCQMRDEQKFRPQFLIDGLNEGLTENFASGADPLILDFKELIVLLYSLNFAEAGNADLDPEKFVWNLADVLCESITRTVDDFKIEKGL